MKRRGFRRKPERRVRAETAVPARRAAGGDRVGPRCGHFFVITKTPFQSSGGGLSTNSIERWM